MAFGRFERPRATPPMSEINMTPLIDVMLVLLVIFMITAPLMTSSLKLELPKTAGGTPPGPNRALRVALDAQGAVHLDDSPVSTQDLSDAARSAAQRDPATEVQLRADETVAYGRVAELIGLLREAGLVRIGFVTVATPPAAPAAPLPGAVPQGTR